MKILIAAGPTREYIDPVRYVSNASSGTMGRTLASAALARGHEVTVVLGPVEVKMPAKAEVVNVTSALEMFDRMKRLFPSFDAAIMAAAVADWRPARRSNRKIKSSDGPPKIEFRKNPDILAALGKIKKNRILVGFALETENLEKNALEKLKSKRADLIVANAHSAIGAASSAVLILGENVREEIGPAGKRKIAGRIVRIVEELAP